MRVDLTKVKDNPMRDFTIDPINDELVEQLKQSIKEDGFWGGIVARKRNGQTELAAGHHRLRAAIAEGYTTADIFVGDIDDAGMIRVYARENATQRGNSSTAITGTVASAMRYLAKLIAVGDPGENFFTSEGLSAARRELEKEGVGRKLIVRFLTGVPGINDGSVQSQLANLKASGDYARISGEVQAEIEGENAAALAEAEEQARQTREWEAEQARLAAERERAREEAKKAREEAERARQERIAAAEQKKREAESAREKAQAEAKAAKEEAAREKAQLESERRKADAARERERIAEEKEQAKVEKERQKKLAAEQTERDRAEKALADKRRKELAEEAKKFEALKKTQETASKAASKAAERVKTFDFEGVAKVLKNDHQVRVFREVVTAENVASHLPVEGQAALAAELVRLAKERDHELSGAFIRENVVSMVLFVKSKERTLDKDEQRKLEEADLNAKMARHMDDFSRSVRGMYSSGIDIKELIQRHPKHPWRLTQEFRNAVKTATNVLSTLHARI